MLWQKNVCGPRIVLVLIQYGFSSVAPALEYLFPLAVGFFKG
jgi:hypothetical protein